MTKQFRIKVNGKPFLVEVEELESGEQQDLGRPSPQELTSSFQPRVVQGSIIAPMPGMVTKICCSPGEEVEVGQVILVLEAMKMENEITADKAGIVQEVRVSSGQNVGMGEILAVIA